MCGNADCEFAHPDGAKTREQRQATHAAHKAKKAAKAAAFAAEKVELEFELDVPEHAEEDLAGPAEEKEQEGNTVTKEELEEVREKIRAEMQAEMEAAMKAEIEAECEKMREVVRQEMLAKEEEKQKKKREHQERLDRGDFSKGFEPKFSKKKFSTPAPKTTAKVASAPPAGLRLSKGAPIRLGPPMRLGPKVLGADKSSKALYAEIEKVAKELLKFQHVNKKAPHAAARPLD